ncbi:MAG TPA: gliding motility protein GldN [Ferruginibacter sp.]|jgi:gliding motility associated protien GldN|nr:gliding motility protein GldN [Chitinophagales bacterium]HMX35910.1 gliding motility protein GldN [Ferruginibacter sp.]HMX80029.1 gliding motility protein GldN [Ferruginibacter sp.]HMZ99829.1 gliding motility protein GldN [Ferruginibacter sp.]HNF01064.1 gliding motility protein GldN [Ferruginibacter sp.]
MNKQLIKYLALAFCFCLFAGVVEAQQKKKTTTRSATKRTTTRKTAKSKTKATINPTVPVTDTVKAVAVAPPPPPVNDSLPIPIVKKSLRPDEAVETTTLKDRTPLPYENLRADDAIYRHKIWREIDAREKINQTFMYTANENNGNQRFISILLKAIDDSAVTVFNSIDDRFTTPMTKAEVARAIGGDSVPVPIYDTMGNLTGTIYKRAEINLDSFYRFRIKEEVIFDKESSRLFWRILGIAPVKDVVTSMGVNLGPTELFWVYYPDMRPILARYEVYNGKNYGGRMSWEDLFESRMFYGRIIKSTIDNPLDRFIRDYPGLKEKGILQLLEGENIKEKIFNYEQDLWSY